MVSFAIALPQDIPARETPASRLARFARAAERAGFDGLWVLDRTQGLQPVMEPLSLLAAAAMVTRRIRLGVAVVILPLRSPVELARTSATIDRLSGGRLDLGVGLGSGRERARAVGLDPGQRRERLEDGVAILRGLWAGDPLDYEGRTLGVSGWAIRPTPVQRPGPPLWFGGHHPDALRRAVALGDGWLGAGSESMADFRREVTAIREDLARHGRGDVTFNLGKRLYLALEDRRGARIPALRRWLGDHYRDPATADRVAAMGPPAAIVEAVMEIAGLGGRLVIFHPVTDVERQLHELAERVIPVARAALGESSAGPA